MNVYPADKVHGVKCYRVNVPDEELTVSTSIHVLRILWEFKSVGLFICPSFFGLDGPVNNAGESDHCQHK